MAGLQPLRFPPALFARIVRNAIDSDGPQAGVRGIDIDTKALSEVSFVDLKRKKRWRP